MINCIIVYKNQDRKQLEICYYQTTKWLPSKWGRYLCSDMKTPLRYMVNWKMAKWKWKSLSHVRLFATPWTYIVHGILQARILEWVDFPFSRGSSQPRSPALQADFLQAEPQGKQSLLSTIICVNNKELFRWYRWRQVFACICLEYFWKGNQNLRGTLNNSQKFKLGDKEIFYYNASFYLSNILSWTYISYSKY